MTKMTLGAHPHMLGFEELERLLERTGKSGGDSYPPFNIEQAGEAAYRISIAVAGFSEDDLAITLEDRQLIVRGRQDDGDEGRVFLHKGIATRAFRRNFVLAQGVEVTGAALRDGLLHIDLTRAEPDTRVHTIEIRRS